MDEDGEDRGESGRDEEEEREARGEREAEKKRRQWMCHWFSCCKRNRGTYICNMLQEKEMIVFVGIRRLAPIPNTGISLFSILV